MKTRMIIGWSTDTIHALHKYVYNIKRCFPDSVDAQVVTRRPVFKGGVGEEITNYFFYPFDVLKSRKADINHITSQEFAYLGYLPLKNIVVTVFDIFPITHDAKYTRFNYKFRINLGIKALSKAKAVICISKFTLKELVERGVPEEKCTVIPLGFNHEVYGKKPYNYLYEKYGLDKSKRYVLHVGSENERKNIVRLVRAFALLRKRHKDVVLLRVGRPQNPVQHQIVLREIKKQRLERYVKYIDQVTDKDLVPIYNLAEISVFPSIYEGFGMPLIEAFACGCPTVTTTGPPMKENARDAALLADPFSVKDIAEKMGQLMSDKGLQKRLAKRGLRYSKNYSWENISEKTVDVYKKVLSKKMHK